jgi:hypothetical protein
MLADDLLEDARHLAARGDTEKRKSCMRRAVSTAYYAIFHLIVEDFVEHWEFEDQRARLARMFDHKKMRDAAFTPKDEKNPTPVETALMDAKTAFRQLQADRHRADYDLAWNIRRTFRLPLRLPRILLESGGQSGTTILRDTICFRCSARTDNPGRKAI